MIGRTKKREIGRWSKILPNLFCLHIIATHRRTRCKSPPYLGEDHVHCWVEIIRHEKLDPSNPMLILRTPPI